MGYDKCPLLKQRKEKLNLLIIQSNVLIGTSPKVTNTKDYNVRRDTAICLRKKKLYLELTVREEAR